MKGEAGTLRSGALWSAPSDASVRDRLRPTIGRWQRPPTDGAPERAPAWPRAHLLNPQAWSDPRAAPRQPRIHTACDSAIHTKQTHLPAGPRTGGRAAAFAFSPLPQPLSPPLQCAVVSGAFAITSGGGRGGRTGTSCEKAPSSTSPWFASAVVPLRGCKAELRERTPVEGRLPTERWIRPPCCPNVGQTSYSVVFWVCWSRRGQICTVCRCR